MGKGGGNCLSPETKTQPTKKESEPAAVAQPAAVPVPAVTEKPVVKAPAVDASTNDKTTMTVKIYIIFYSTYGHVYKMAQAMKEGVDSVEGVEGILYQVAETLPEEVLTKMHAAPKPDVPVITAADLPNADGFIFGMPTRYGRAPAQMSAFFDTTGSLWQSGALVGKPASFFFSTACQAGGQENTAASSVSFLVHHGMIFVPPGYSYGPGMFNMETVQGGSPWGAGTMAGPTGARQPTEGELGYATHQGKYFAGKAKLLAAK